jgi:TRAP-type mannitol/chloroaromatic compound transport system permease small subunit
MNKEDQHIKPLMQIILGVGLFVIYLLTESPINTLAKYKGTNWYNPSDELFFFFLKWICLFVSVFLIIVGIAQIVNRLISHNGKNK